MQPYSFYAAYLGTLISIVGFTILTIRYNDKKMPDTLSIVVARKKASLLAFRFIVWLGAILLSWTVLFYISPRVSRALHIYLIPTYLAIFISQILVGVFAAKGNLENKLHEIFAYSMGAGLLLADVIFTLSLIHMKAYFLLELIVSIIMFGLAMMIYADKKRFIYYELLFIYLSQLSIIVATLGLR